MAANEGEARASRADECHVKTCAVAETLRPVIRLGIAPLERRLGLERSTISRRVKAGLFPRPIYFAGRRFWDEHEISLWEKEQVSRQAEAERRAHERMAPARAAKLEMLP